MLTDGEASGYDLKKEFESSFSHFFAAGYGSIYPALSSLADQGLVDCEEIPQDGKPDRKLYQITVAGRRYRIDEIPIAGDRRESAGAVHPAYPATGATRNCCWLNSWPPTEADCWCGGTNLSPTRSPSSTRTRPTSSTAVPATVPVRRPPCSPSSGSAGCTTWTVASSPGKAPGCRSSADRSEKRRLH